MRIRQVALVARELEAVVSELCSALRAEVTYRDPLVATFGLENALVAVGTDFIEVVSPVRDDASASRFLQSNGGDGGYMVIVQTDDLAADRRRIEAAGVRVVWEIALDDIATIHLHPRDLGGAIVSLDQPQPPESWRWAGPRWQKARGRAESGSIVGAELQATNPAALAARWAAVLGREAVADDDGYAIGLDSGRIRFTPLGDERGEGLAAIELSGSGGPPRELTICGLRIRIGAQGS